MSVGGDDYASPWQTRLGWLWLAVVICAIMTPVFYNLYVSFNELGFGAARYVFTVDWYFAVFEDAALTRALGWTLAVAVGTAVFTVPFALLAAKLYKRLTNKLWLVFLLLLPLFAPPDIFATTLLVYFKSLNGMFGAVADATGLPVGAWFQLGFGTAVIGMVVYTLPYAFVVILITMGRYNPEHTEAARACGASPWQAFWQVEFPQIRPGVLSATSFTVILVFNEYVRSNALKGGFDTFTTVLISQMLNTGMSEQSYAMGGMISIVSIGGVTAILLWTWLRQEQMARRLRAPEGN
ncbi:MAG: ABC transporter permease subunit [Pseudomonadota bacterium]